jgi:fructan beta-fructosidase
MKALLLMMSAALLATTPDAAPTRTNDGPFRLQYHFTPPRNWTNDPNGLVFYKGEYHLFYQFNPFGTKWGHMTWGHAISSDLVHWQDLPPALKEENGIMMFSGSAVVDEHNTSGLCAGKSGDRSCLVAIYTGHTAQRQTQNIAYSNDRGRTWTKYRGNPVIDLGLKDFRDPKVLWYEQQHKWVMATALSDKQKLRFFESADLIHWKPLSDFGPEGATGGAWECPDLFELPLPGNGGTKWVLVVNLNPGGVAGGSGTQYFVGSFDGTRFHNDNPPAQQLWMDYGKDYYAAVSFFGHPAGDARRIMIGWFSNWQYANDTPESDWRGAMTIPREVSLVQTEQGVRVVQRPVREMETLKNPAESWAIADHPMSAVEANEMLARQHVRGKMLQIDLQLALGTAKQAGLEVFRGGEDRTLVGVDREKSQVFIDRTRSGLVSFNNDFPVRRGGPLQDSRNVSLRILLDRSSVEVFAENDRTTLSDRVYPSAADQGIQVFTDGGEAQIQSLRISGIRSVWK